MTVALSGLGRDGEVEGMKKSSQYQLLSTKPTSVYHSSRPAPVVRTGAAATGTVT